MPGPKTALEKAKEQAAAYASTFAPTTLPLDNGDSIEIPPHPNLRMLDDEQMEAYDELLFEADTLYDREPDIVYPESTLSSGAVVPSTTQRGALLLPYRIDGELVKPPHSVRVVQIALGEDGYEKLRNGGKSAGDVWRIWNTQGLEVAAREQMDPFRNGSGRPVAPPRGGTG